MKRRALVRRSLLTAAMIGAVALVASKGAFAQTGYTFQVIASSEEYGGSQYQVGDLNNNKQFTFNIVGAEKDSGGGGETTYFWDGSQILRIQPSDTKLSDGSTLTSGNMWTPHGVNDAGKVAYVADTDQSPHAIVVWDSKTRTYTLIAKVDTVVEGGKLTSAGVQLEGRMVADINNKDQVVWSEGLIPPGSEDANDAVFMFDPATNKITTVARKGTPLPGGKEILNALFPNINDAGQVVFMANTADDENYGVYAWEGGNITAIATPGTKVGDITIAQAKLPRNSDGGHIVFRGETVSSGGAAPVGEDTGYFIYSAGKITKVIAPGDSLPGGKFVATEPGGGRRSVGVNKNGVVVFKAVLENDQSGIFLWKDGQITPLVRAGQQLETAGTVDSVVQGVGNQNGYHMAINDFGDVAFSATFGETHTVVLATAPR